ncbi:unnamed protein product [Soboliphyme baturini]|uniref:VPS13 domain-containing protein n=1 Tax=Soboliphyme baturini TaxID=241478 RepID=A0A183IM73_9BILA|nr:unnamed protein product [Soboliphyme baturini]
MAVESQEMLKMRRRGNSVEPVALLLELDIVLSFEKCILDPDFQTFDLYCNMLSLLQGLIGTCRWLSKSMETGDEDPTSAKSLGLKLKDINGGSPFNEDSSSSLFNYKRFKKVSYPEDGLIVFMMKNTFSSIFFAHYAFCV